MNTQNTPVHMRLWHHEFWLMSLANFLMNMSVTMLIPTMPLWLLSSERFSILEVSVVMGVYGIGLFSLGIFCSYLVQRYRRNVVCLFCVFMLSLLHISLYYVNDAHSEWIELRLLLVLRLLIGALFSLAQMVLMSTLVIDCSESFHRTEANYASSWFGRFALSLGPVLGLVLYYRHGFGFDSVAIASALCLIMSFVLIRLVSFPFKAPDEDIPKCSLDRFLLPVSWPLSLNLLLVSIPVGILMTTVFFIEFYTIMMAGFLLAIIAQRVVFVNAEPASEAVCGIISLLVALLLRLFVPTLPAAVMIAPVALGFAIGIVCSRFQLYFIKMSRHCQRGTSQSTFFLSWEFGLSIGLALGYCLSVFYAIPHLNIIVAICLCLIATIMYLAFTHKWYLGHKNR